ncbi:MAG: precorrin-6y C5,15-methyltransferase (decarboxylating) subunit CbiE [Alphaproteobacteria bacterium]|nr:precorrin-6y C5,15-methyltransferase (decarboxylating) subunit CbiE [Alphaproteobacteria bacterium]
MTAWITVIGIGADGLAGLSPAGLEAVGNAALLIGGARHQDMVADTELAMDAERLTWSCGIGPAMDEMEKWRDKPVVVLASGDPMDYGAGSTLARRFDPLEITVIPHPGAFSLACARMVWSLPDTVTMTVHGRAFATLNLHMHPDARIIALSWNGETPKILADILSAKGFGASRMTVFSDMGAAGEQRFEGTAGDWSHEDVPDLNTVCIECVAGADAVFWPRTPGLPETAYVHDTQITKREVRAVTIAHLAPQPGQVLWDVGAGCGSVAIEWLRAVDGAQAIALESDAARSDFIRQNADNLGVPHLGVIMGTAPDALVNLPDPDTVFVGGGVSQAGVLETCWDRLATGGALVSNAVTMEAQQRLMAFGGDVDATFTRLSVARSGEVGKLTAMRPMMEVLQMVARKT